MQVSWRFEETCDWEVFGMEGLICVFEVGGGYLNCLYTPLSLAWMLAVVLERGRRPAIGVDRHLMTHLQQQTSN